MEKHQAFGFLRRFKTLLGLVLLCVVLGGWLLPRYYTVHYGAGDYAADFPVVAMQPDSNPDLTGLGEWSPLHYAWTEDTDFVSPYNEQQHIYFRSVGSGSETHYELKAVTAIDTQTAAYRLVDGRPQPMYLRVTGLIVWMHAVVITLSAAVLILIIQVVLGLVRSSSLSPQAKKKLRRYRR